ncbi:hypothetical protein PFISCL1PPCAC_17218, partial [Pristionchus fissidentatus]
RMLLGASEARNMTTINVGRSFERIRDETYSALASVSRWLVSPLRIDSPHFFNILPRFISLSSLLRVVRTRWLLHRLFSPLSKVLHLRLQSHSMQMQLEPRSLHVL